MRNLRNLQRILAGRQPGDEVRLDYTREGREQTTTLKLARLADVLGEDE